MKNVVLIVLDTVRKDYFDEYATNLRRLADVEFDRCFAPSSWSIPSHSSILSGELASQHGVHSYNPDYSDLNDTLLDDLDGYNTYGVSANGAVSDTFGVDTLFDEFHSFAGNVECSPKATSFKEVEDTEEGIRRYADYLLTAKENGVLIPTFLNGLYIKANNLFEETPLPKLGDFGAKAVIDRSTSTIIQQDAEPFFLFQNFIDAHGPMQNFPSLDNSVPYHWSSNRIDASEVRDHPREQLSEYLETYRDLYAANVEYLDQQVSRFVKRVQEITTNDTVFLITADHGEELRFEGEPDLGHMGFSTGLLHVPFVVINTETTEFSGLTSLLDVREIVREVANQRGVPDVTQERVPAERIGMMFYDGDDEYWTRGIRTIYEDDVRYEWDSLGNSAKIPVRKSADGERIDCVVPDGVKAEFEVELTEYVHNSEQIPDTGDVSEQTQRHLEDLGYKM